jgi:hypothetical protein
VDVEDVVEDAAPLLTEERTVFDGTVCIVDVDCGEPVVTGVVGVVEGAIELGVLLGCP